VIETLTKARQPYPQKEAIYFIAPITESVNAIIDDHARGQPLYAAAHIYLTSCKIYGVLSFSFA
jgi:syntaxin-binding protein 1